MRKHIVFTVKSSKTGEVVSEWSKDIITLGSEEIVEAIDRMLGEIESGKYSPNVELRYTIEGSDTDNWLVTYKGDFGCKISCVLPEKFSPLMKKHHNRTLYSIYKIIGSDDDGTDVLRLAWEGYINGYDTDRQALSKLREIAKDDDDAYLLTDPERWVCSYMTSRHDITGEVTRTYNEYAPLAGFWRVEE